MASFPEDIVRNKTLELMHTLEIAPSELIKQTIQTRRVVFPEELLLLLRNRYFHAAMEYEGLDLSQEQVLLCDSAVFEYILELVSDPASTEYGLYFLQRLRPVTFSPSLYERAVASCTPLLTNRTLGYCRNPLLVCLLVLELLTRAQRLAAHSTFKHYGKLRVRWVQVFTVLDKRLVQKYQRDLVLLYLDKDLRARSVLSLIQTLDIPELMLTVGFGLLLDYGWQGPYNYVYHPLAYSKAWNHLQGRSESASVYFFSLQSWSVSPALRFFTSLLVQVTVVILIQFEFVRMMSDIQEYVAEMVLVPGTTIKLKERDSVFVCLAIYSFSDSLYYLFLFALSRLERRPFTLSKSLLFAALLMSAGSIYFLVVLYGGYYTNTKQLDAGANAVSIWIIGTWLHIVLQLEFTEWFGVVVKTVKAMIVKTLGFSLLLGIVVYVYAAIYMMRNYKVYQETADIQSTLFYFFSIMLGNYDPSVMYTPYDSWAMPMAVTFSIITSIILLNFLIAMLSQLYESNQASQLLEYRRILSRFIALNLPSAKYRVLNCSVSPFSLLSALFVPLLFTSQAKRVSTLIVKGTFLAVFLPINLVVFLVTSLALVLPAYIYRFFALAKGRTVASKTFSEESEEAEKSTCKERLQWAVCGLFILLGAVGKDTVQFAKVVMKDADSSILKHESLHGFAKVSPETENPTSLSRENRPLQPLFSPRQDHASALLSRLAATSDLDTALLQRISIFSPHLATPWLTAEETERRFNTALEFVDVELVRITIEKVELHHDLDTKKALKRLLEANGLLKK